MAEGIPIILSIGASQVRAVILRATLRAFSPRALRLQNSNAEDTDNADVA
jgi:hypothetical protein